MSDLSKYQAFARKAYKPFGERDEMWHPEVLAECDRIDAEETARLAAEQAKIKEIVENAADISAALTGNIVFKVSFRGSHAKTKILTKGEKALVMKLNDKKLKGDKPLFVCDEYDDLMNFIAKRRLEFASFGIPHTAFESAHVTSIANIPEIEELANKTQAELKEHVDCFLAAWPAAIDHARDHLLRFTTSSGEEISLFNEGDYASVDALRKQFQFSHEWLAFGVPEELKQFDIKIYEAAQAKAKKVWAEIEANGVALLRQTIADLVGDLAASLTPKEDGTKRKFYASSVEKINQFIETFKNRNICKDAELEVEVEKLRAIVSSLDCEKLSAGPKGDEILREKVRVQMEQAKLNLDNLTHDASARVIKLND
jgi:hypothetical protein